MASKTLAYGAIIVIIIAIGAAVFFLMKGTTTASGTTTVPSTSKTNSKSYAVQMTDPESVPSGTQAFIVTYSQVKLKNSGSSTYTNLQSSGTVNLTALDANGQAQTIAILNSTNASFDGATLLITSAKIVMNNTNYTVAVPNGQVMANVSGSSNSSTGGMLIDLSPVVVQVYGSSNTSFAMAASASAVPISRAEINSSGATTLGANTSLTAGESAALSSSLSNVSVNSATAAVSGNSTSLTVALTNTGSTNAVIKAITLSGYARAASPGNTSASASASSNSSNQSASSIFGGLLLNNSVSGDLNVSGNLTAQAKLYIAQATVFQNNYHNSLNFVVNSNGEMQLPQSQSQVGASGYVIAPHQNATFKFNGVAALGYKNMVAILIPNQSYSVEAIGNAQASAASTTTAT
jgi:hypothetical protein